MHHIHLLYNSWFYSGLFLTASRRPSLVRIHRASCLDAKRPPFRYVLYSSVAHFWLWFCFQNVPSVATPFHIQPRSYVTNDRSMALCMAGKSLKQALVWTECPSACNMIEIWFLWSFFLGFSPGINTRFNAISVVWLSLRAQPSNPIPISNSTAFVMRSVVAQLYR